MPILGFFFDDDDNSGSERSAQQRAEQRARELEATVRTLRQEADEARRRAIDAENRVQSVVTSSREEIEAVDRARRVAHETAENAQRRQEELEQAMHEAEEALQRAEEARLAVERRWFEGVRPERRPSDQDITQMRARHGYSPNFIHLAVLALLEVGSHPSSTPSVACPIMILLPLVRGLSKLPIIPQVTLTHVQTLGSFGMTFLEQALQTCLIGNITMTLVSTSSTASSYSSTIVSWNPTSPSSVPAGNSQTLRHSLFAPSQTNT